MNRIKNNKVRTVEFLDLVILPRLATVYTMREPYMLDRRNSVISERIPIELEALEPEPSYAAETYHKCRWAIIGNFLHAPKLSTFRVSDRSNEWTCKFGPS